MLDYDDAIERSIDFINILKEYSVNISFDLGEYSSKTIDIPSTLAGISAALAFVYGKQTSEVGEEMLQKLSNEDAADYLHES